MPIYEYLCATCHRKSSFFVRTVSTPLEPVCQSCGGADLKKAVSSFAYHRSLSDRWEAAGDPSDPGDDYYKDPSNIGRWVEQKWQQTMGEEPLPGEIQEMIGAAREGEMPKPMPSLPDFPDPLAGLR